MKVLAIGAHYDDVELGCGGTLHKLIQGGAEVMYLGLSSCYKPELISECQLACKVLGIQTLELFNYPVRRFHEHRQEILDTLIKFRDKFQPDIVYTHSSNDLHQDHKVVFEESFRAFKNYTLFGYNFQWNQNVSLDHLCVTIDIEKKVEAISKYESQASREPFQKGYIQAANFTGERFEVIKLNQKILL